ncbi:MAG: glycosyltransferase family 2 protein, partial [Acidimicrobiia bacterium]
MIQLPTNTGGPAGPINTGIEASEGEFVSVLDQDDLFVPTKLESEISLLANRDDLSFVCSFCGFTNLPNEIALPEDQVTMLLWSGRPVDEYVELAGRVALCQLMKLGNFVWGYPGFVFRRGDWRQRGGLDEQLKIASDYDFLCWLCIQGRVGLFPKVHYIYREHQSNLTRQHALMKKEIAQVQARYLGFLHRVTAGTSLSHVSLEDSGERDISHLEPENAVRQPRVSVVLIFQNALPLIQEAVASVFAQTCDEWELLLVDDGSDDCSTEIARDYALRWFPKVRYLQHERHESRGMCASRNLGISQARGEFVAFLDVEDSWMPNKLESALRIFESNRDVQLLVAPIMYW